MAVSPLQRHMCTIVFFFSYYETLFEENEVCDVVYVLTFSLCPTTEITSTQQKDDKMEETVKKENLQADKVSGLSAGYAIVLNACFISGENICLIFSRFSMCHFRISSSSLSDDSITPSRYNAIRDARFSSRRSHSS